MVGKPGRSGRKPKPSRVREVEGRRGHRPIVPDIVAEGLPLQPLDLSDEEQQLWEETVGSLPDGVLARADSAAIEIFVSAWATAREARRSIRRTGLLVQSPNGPTRHPLFGLWHRSATLALKAAGELGASPTARVRIKTDEDEFDPLELLLDGCELLERRAAAKK